MSGAAAKEPHRAPQRSQTVAAMVRARAEDDNVGLLYGEQSWTWRQIVDEAAVRAAWLRATLDPARPPHIGVLLPNVPEFVFQILGAALVGACVVGANPARRGAELARDIEHTDCQFVLADAMYADLYSGVIRVEDQPWAGYTGAPYRPTILRRRRRCSCCSPPARRRHLRPRCAARSASPGTRQPG